MEPRGASRAHFFRYPECKSTATERNHSCASGAGQLGQQCSKKTDADDRDRVFLTDVAARKNSHRAAKRLARKSRFVETGGKRYCGGGIAHVVIGVCVIGKNSDAVALCEPANCASDVFNCPPRLMAECTRSHRIGEPRLAFPWRNIRCTHATAFDVYQQLISVWLGNLCLDDADLARRTDRCCAHLS